MTLSTAGLKSLITATRKTMKPGASYVPDPKVRTRLLAEHGRDGLRVLLACEHPSWSAEVFELGDPGCPWPAAASPLELATAAFGPLAPQLPRLIKRLSGATLTCAVRHTPQADAPDLGGWFLMYALPERGGPTLWIGGPPEPAPEFHVEGWELPPELGAFYRQHNGFGVLLDEFGWTGVGPGVQPSVHLAVPALAADVHTADLLRFSHGEGDAGEGGWCFAHAKPGARKKKPAGAPESGLTIVDFDDRLGIRGEPVPFDFLGFFDRWMVGDPKDELPLAESP
jgi:hypothetical protein